MKTSVEELGKWLAENPVLHSARINGDVATMAGEASCVFKDTVTETDVTNAVKVHQTALLAKAVEKKGG